ncbi:unnamed protein product [Rangifer tarandus platyrhynchus]|uniref:Uncharacterized protein n=1 Tax=Rangifer tarandus platyrhynchus TaxID=3082113 RepID=A0ABN8XMH5_RANTA|nr:unnamed protein product [Rangifer tarandus platyrhynchus]
MPLSCTSLLQPLVKEESLSRGAVLPPGFPLTGSPPLTWSAHSSRQQPPQGPPLFNTLQWLALGSHVIMPQPFGQTPKCHAHTVLCRSRHLCFVLKVAIDARGRPGEGKWQDGGSQNGGVEARFGSNRAGHACA